VRRRPVEPDRPIDVHDAVDLMLLLADALELADYAVEPEAIPGYHPGRGARLRAGDAVVAHAGQLGERPLRRVGLDGPAVAVEADVEALRGAPRRDRSFRIPSPFPPSEIDLAFVVSEDVPAGAIVSTLQAALGPVLEDARLFDEFRSEQLGPGQRSLAFTVRLRSPARTLTQRDVAELRQRAIDAVVEQHHATLRA